LEQLEQVDLQQMVSQAKGLKALTQFLVLSHQLAEAMVEGVVAYQMLSPGGPGGSGGGGGCSYNQPNAPLNSQPGAGNEGGFSPVEGYAGAAGGLYYWTGGGGGGSGAVGGPSYQPAAGTPSTISGSDVTYALGGGGAGQGAGGANTGTGGGGGGDNGAGPSGGSGVVFIKEAEVIGQASGIWDMNALYDNVKAGTWTT
jgi:hypothetical protein